MPKTATRRRAPARPTASKRAAPRTPARDQSEIVRKGWATRRARDAEVAAEAARAAERLAAGRAAAAAIGEAVARTAEPEPNVVQRSIADAEARDALMASARDTGFDHAIGARVLILSTDTPGEVTGRADFEGGNTEYQVRWRQPDGRFTETWLSEAAISREL